jgi:hypothetical protein
MILTVPEQLRITFYRDRREGKLLSALMRSGYECLEEVVSLAVRQKVKIGTIVVVQTHGRPGHCNPHLHIIMTSGGVNEETGKWVELGYFPYEIIHKKWQYHLFKMLKEKRPTEEIKTLINVLWKKYPKGPVVHVTKGADLLEQRPKWAANHGPMCISTRGASAGIPSGARFHHPGGIQAISRGLRP